MSYDFQRLSDVEAMEKIPDGASVIAEVNGEIKRLPGDGFGGNYDAIIRHNGDGGYPTSSASDYVLEQGSYDAILEKFESKKYAKIAIVYGSSFGMPEQRAIEPVFVRYRNGQVMIAYFDANPYTNKFEFVTIFLNSDGTFSDGTATEM